MNRIDNLFATKKKVLSFFYTAGFPELDHTIKIAELLERSNIDMIELGFPYSDPLADGPTIQKSNERAIKNGMNLSVLFQQLKELRSRVKIPLLLMGYLNPIILYGVDRFLEECNQVAVDGLIIPDMPLEIYLRDFSVKIKQYDLSFPFLITPNSTDQRIRELDQSARGFIYAVSSNAITGSTLKVDLNKEQYLARLEKLKLKNPIVVGFGISDKAGVELANRYCAGAIIGSAFIRHLEGASKKEDFAIKEFVSTVMS